MSEQTAPKLLAGRSMLAIGLMSGARNPHLDADAHRAARAGDGRVRPCRRLVDRLSRGASVRLSRGAQPGRPAAHISWHHRCTADPGTSHTWCAKIPIHDSIHWMLV